MAQPKGGRELKLWLKHKHTLLTKKTELHEEHRHVLQPVWRGLDEKSLREKEGVKLYWLPFRKHQENNINGRYSNL